MTIGDSIRCMGELTLEQRKNFFTSLILLDIRGIIVGPYTDVMDLIELL